MGNFGDAIYTLNDNQAVEQCNLLKSNHDSNGNYLGENVYLYYIDDEISSESEYLNKYNYYQIDSMIFIGYNEGMVEVTEANITQYIYS